MKVLIAGSGGFLGRHFVSYLHEKNIKPYCLVRKKSLLPDFAETIELDLLDRDKVKRLIHQIRPDYVINLAADLSEREHTKLLSSELSKTYFMGINLVDALCVFPPSECFISIGSCEEYGELKQKYEENLKCAPCSIYGTNKLRLTKKICSLSQEFGVPSIILRPSVIYGPEQSSQFLIPSLIRSLISGGRFAMTSGVQIRDFVHVEDVCSAIFKAMLVKKNSPNPIFNIASGKSISIKELALLVAELTGTAGKELIEFGSRENPKPSILSYKVSIEKAKSVLGWCPKKDFTDGLLDIIEQEKRFNSSMRKD